MNKGDAIEFFWAIAQGEAWLVQRFGDHGDRISGKATWSIRPRNHDDDSEEFLIDAEDGRAAAQAIGVANFARVVASTKAETPVPVAKVETVKRAYRKPELRDLGSARCNGCSRSLVGIKPCDAGYCRTCCLQRVNGHTHGRNLCAHGNPPHDCNACDVASDLAFDANRE